MNNRQNDTFTSAPLISRGILSYRDRKNRGSCILLVLQSHLDWSGLHVFLKSHWSLHRATWCYLLSWWSFVFNQLFSNIKTFPPCSTAKFLLHFFGQLIFCCFSYHLCENIIFLFQNHLVVEKFSVAATWAILSLFTAFLPSKW